MNKIKNIEDFLEERKKILLERLRIDVLHDYINTNISVYVYGGNGFRNEHGTPHFIVYLDKSKSEGIVIEIPNEIQWKSSKELNIIASFDNCEWNGRTSLKKEIIDWLDKKSNRIPQITNLQYIISSWDGLNAENNNVKKINS